MNCFKPIRISDPRALPDLRGNIRQMLVPCGRCAACLSNKSSDWVTRLKVETFYATSAYFVTLTYADPFLPHLPNGNPTHSKRDIQLFLKRLRNHVPDKIRYFIVSEYGDPDGGFRPHYHMLLFNWPPEVDLMTALAKSWVTSDGRMMSIWCPENIAVCEDGHILYVCKYIQKNQDIPKGYTKNWMLCSRRPAIGSQILTDENKNFYRQSAKSTIFINGEQRYMPRYYKDRIFTDPDSKLRLLLAKECYVNAKSAKDEAHELRLGRWFTRRPVKVVPVVDYHTGEVKYELHEERPVPVGNVDLRRDLNRAKIDDFNRKYNVKKRKSYKF